MPVVRGIGWKLIGLAGIAGVTAVGVVVVRRRRRSWNDLSPDELRRTLHERLARADAATEQPVG